MDLKLENKTALVTGSTAGIGFATARSLAHEGAHVFVNGRTAERVDKAIAQIKKETGNQNVKGLVADFSDVEQINSLLAQLPEVDILVNNVAIFEPRAFAEITDESWVKSFELNVMSGIRLSRVYFGQMLKNNWGRIIFISSESAIQIPAEMIDYGVTKTAQIAVARGLAELTKGTAVTVNSVLPGPTYSEGVSGFIGALAKEKGVTNAGMEKDFFINVRPSSILQRFIEPDEIANLVTYLASPLSAATNGSALRADGGVIKSAF